MKKTIKLTLFLMFVLVFLLLITIPFETTITYATSDNDEILSLDESIVELFGDKAIIEIEYFYNFDNFPDYIYVNCEAGYAIYKSDTLELMEYSPIGSLTFDDLEGQIYYAGPGNYYCKQNNEFVNLLTDEHITFSNSEAVTYSNQIRSLFSTRNETISITNYFQNLLNTHGANILSHYPENTDDFEYGDAPGSVGTTYIDNYEFFFKNPRHGINYSNTCVAVATQLLLNYNNYYNDRRIIPDNYLNGWDFNSNSVSNPEYNPNYCTNPDSKTRETLGSSGVNESDEHTYYNYIIQNIPASSNIDKAKNGIQKILDSRNRELGSNNNILYEVKVIGGSNSYTANIQDIRAEIDSGRPLYLSLRSADKNSGHAVVAYGYQEKNSTMGYIVHFGWSDDYAQFLNVWTNSSWCYGYLTLQINHTHNYSILLDSGEARCDECGHRVNAFTTERLIGSSIKLSKVNVQLAGDITIPNPFNGKIITTIGDAAFENQQSIKSLTIPETVTYIGAYAFDNCSAEKINFIDIDKIIYIGEAAFRGCWMNSFTVPSTIKTIFDSTFERCRMREINFLDASEITYIGESAFCGCWITSIDIPPNVKTIRPYTFYGTMLYSVNFSENTILETIEEYAFAYSHSLSKIKIPSTVKIIGERVFEDCTSLSNVFNDDSSVQHIGNYAFYNCSGIMEVKIPKTLISLGVSAFENCTCLMRAYFDADCPLTEIQNSTFAGCEVFGLYTFPSGLTKIGANAFADTYLKCIVIPKSVTTIGANALPPDLHCTIYTEHEQIPKGWAADLNSTNHALVLGCKIDMTSNSQCHHITSFVKSNSNPINKTGEAITNPGNFPFEFEGWFTNADFSGTKYNTIEAAPNGTLYPKWKTQCVAEGTLITLADGSQKAVEELTGDEMLLVWNMFTGKYDVAPILFIDKDPTAVYEVINLHFSDGTSVKVISEHAFWDFDLNKYVYLRSDASKYIGHMFNKQSTDKNGNMTYTKVQLVDVVITHETTTAYSPVTYGHLCYYVNGMLSMPGGITGLINIFDVDGETLTYDKEAFDNDIETYGLFTYEEFAELLPVPEYVFEAVNGQYLKVAIGKGLIDIETLARLFETYKNLL